MAMPYGGYGQHGGNASGGAYGPPGGGGPPGITGPLGGGYAPQDNYGGSPGSGNQYNQSSTGAYGESNSMMSSGKSAVGEVAFAAACCIVVGSVASGFCFISSFQFADWLFMTYLFVFGLILAVLDAPILGNVKWVADAKIYVAKYAQLVTRSIGKGTTLVFLGSALSMSMWDNLTGGMWMFLAVVLSGVPILVGLFFIGYGFLKSQKLEKARKQLETSGDHRFDSFAGPGGLTMSDFNNYLSTDYGLTFDAGDLKLIFNALSSNPMWMMQGTAGVQGGYQNQQMEGAGTLSRQEFSDWCKGGWVCL